MTTAIVHVKRVDKPKPTLSGCLLAAGIGIIVYVVVKSEPEFVKGFVTGIGRALESELKDRSQGNVTDDTKGCTNDSR